MKLKEMSQHPLNLIQKGPDVPCDLQMNTKLVFAAQVIKEGFFLCTLPIKLNP